MLPTLDNGAPVPQNAPFVIYTDDQGQVFTYVLLHVRCTYARDLPESNTFRQHTGIYPNRCLLKLYIFVDVVSVVDTANMSEIESALFRRKIARSD